MHHSTAPSGACASLRASAGTLESNDIFIRLTRLTRCAPPTHPTRRAEPAGHSGEGGENTLALKSIVIRQFGDAIERAIMECLAERGVSGVHVEANDRGALDCTIRARMEAALDRLAEAEKAEGAL